MAEILAVPLRRVVWKVEQGFVDSDPFDGRHWGLAGSEEDPTAWTPWDDIYDGELLFSFIEASKANANTKLQTGSWVQVEPSEELEIAPGVPIQNFSIMSEYVTEMGRIRHSQLTGLRPVNQRKISKAIRRAIGLGLIPAAYKHPEIVRRAIYDKGVMSGRER